VIVISFRFHQNRPSDYGDVRGQNLDYCITLATGLYNSLYDRTGLICSHICWLAGAVLCHKRLYSTVALVPAMSTMYVWRGIT